MGKGDEMVQEVLAPRPGRPVEPGEPAQWRCEVTVVFTSPAATLAALRRAAALASQLAAEINLVAPHVVPYPLPLENPPVRLALTESRFADFAKESPIEIKVRVYLCRDRWEALKVVLHPCSLVVVGAQKRPWPTEEKALARMLRREGHKVVLIEKE